MKNKRAAIYVRVSTLDQHPEMQERELREYVARRKWVLRKVYCDKGFSGALEKRPALDALMSDCRRGKVDFVVVWKFDRFARSLRQLLNALESFKELGIGFASCTEAINTEESHGVLLFQIVGAIAQWERCLTVERVRAGLAHARKRGRRLGRPPLRTFSSDEVSEIMALFASGVSIRQLALRFNTTQYIVSKIAAERQTVPKN
jgi:DNA invertase Pin-like site-specific DNA recombinase